MTLKQGKVLPFAPNLEQRNLAEQCADHIVLMIANGELKPGSRLVEKDLSERMGVSRVPIREALRLLQAQGVAQSMPNRSSIIAGFGSAETADLLELRLSVERLAIIHVMRRIPFNATIISELAARVDHLRSAAKQKDRLVYCQADLAFHDKIVSLSESPVLKPAWASLSRGVLVFLMQERHQDYDYKQSIEDHVFLFELIRSGRAAAVDREIERHIMRHVRGTAANAEPLTDMGS